MAASRKRGLSLFLAGGSVFWLLLCTFALITMQLSPPKPDLWHNLFVVALGLVGSGLFGWGSLAIRRADAYLDGTTLYVRSGFWFGYRSADLGRVTRVRISEDKRDGGYDILLSGHGNLNRFPLAHPATGVFPVQSAERLANALEANPNKAVVGEAINALRGAILEATDEAG